MLDTATMQKIMIEVDRGQPAPPDEPPELAAFREKMVNEIRELHERGEMLHFTPEAEDVKLD